MAPLQVRVSTLGGPVCEVSACDSWTLAELQQAIEAKANVRPIEQRLVYGTLELRDKQAHLADFLDGAGDGSSEPGEQGGVCKPSLELELIHRTPLQVMWLEGMDKIKLATHLNAYLDMADDELLDDKEVMLAALAAGCNWTLVSERLQGDPEVILAGIRRCGLLLEDVGPEIQNDRDMVLEAVKQDGLALQFASEALRGDREVVLTAIKSNGTALEFASKQLKNDFHVVMEAVRRRGVALQFASVALRRNEEVIDAAVAQNVEAEEFADVEWI